MKTRSKKILRRALSALLSACLLLGGGAAEIGGFVGEGIGGIVANAADTYGDFEYEANSEGGVTITGYNRYITTMDVVIPSEIQGKKVTKLDSAFFGQNWMRSVTIPNSVTSIGERAFEDCKRLESVIIPNSVTSIGDRAFGGCKSLTSVTIGNSVASIGEWAFFNCTSLTSVTIGNSVASIGDWAFCDCSSLKSVTIPDSVTSIGDDAFDGCKSLTSVTIGNSVASIGEAAFLQCTSLTSITIPNSVTSIGERAFEDCTSLTNVTIGNSVTSIGKYAFEGCASLTSITIPNSVTSIGERAFEDCTSLTSITIPDSVTSFGSYVFSNTAWYDNQPDGDIYIGKVYYLHKGDISKDTIINVKDGTIAIADNAFYFVCLGVTIPKSVIKIGTGISSRNGVTNIEVDENNKNYSSIDGVLFNKNQTELLMCGSGKKGAYKIPDTVNIIGNAAFRGCGLTSITIPNSVTSIEDNAFESTNLKNLIIPNSVKRIGHGAFECCRGLITLSISEGVTNIEDYAFFDCENLLVVELPNTLTSIGYRAFFQCERLSSMTIPSSVQEIGDQAIGYHPVEKRNQWSIKPIVGFYIYGTTGSAAEKYAVDNHFGFNRGIQLSQKYLDLSPEESEIIIPKIADNDYKNQTLLWESSDTNVATVDNGIVKAVGVGTSVIRAYFIDNDGYTRYSEDCYVTVSQKAKVESFEILTKKLSKKLKDKMEIKAEMILSDTGESSKEIIEEYIEKYLTWVFSDNSVAEVDSVTADYSNSYKKAVIKIKLKPKTTGYTTLRGKIDSKIKSDPLGIDKSGECKINIYPNCYVYELDGWCIGNYAYNFGTENYTISPSIYYDTYGISHPINATLGTAAYLIERGIKMFNGNCFGLSMLSIANYAGIIDLKDYFSNTGDYLTEYGYQSIVDGGYYTLNGNDRIVKLVERAMVSQDSTAFKKAEVFGSDYSKVIEYINANIANPLLVTLDEANGGGHAVVIDPSEKPFKTNNDWYSLKLYDPNCPYGKDELENPQKDYKWTASLLLNVNSGEWKYKVVGDDGSEVASMSGKKNFLTHKYIKFYDVTSLSKEFFDTSIKLDSIEYKVKTYFGNTITINEGNQKILDINNGEINTLVDGYDYDTFFSGDNNLKYIILNGDDVSYTAPFACVTYKDSMNNNNIVSTFGNSTVDINRKSDTIDISSDENTEVLISLGTSNNEASQTILETTLENGANISVSSNNEKIVVTSDRKINVKITKQDTESEAIEETITVDGKNTIYLNMDTISGDTNGDGKVNIADALMISRADAGLVELTAAQEDVSDVNGDGKINIADALMISRYDAGLIDKFN